MTIDILLHYLPPALPNLPSLSLSTLKTYINSKGFNSKILYWNLIMHNWYTQNKVYDKHHRLLFPFIVWININKNKTINQKLVNNFQKFFPELKLNNYEKTKNFLLQNNRKFEKFIIDTITPYLSDNILFHGFSARFEQWISAYVICSIIKKLNPSTITVIGGFNLKENAIAAIESFECFDYAIWGEGELPLVELIETLKKNNKDNINNIRQLVHRNNLKHITHQYFQKKQSIFHLDNFPYPEYNDYYEQVKKSQVKNWWLPISTSRGCFWQKCKFCTQHTAFIFRKKDNYTIIKEIDYLVKKYNKTIFEFCDSSINKNNKYFSEFLELLIDYQIKNSIRFFLRGNVIPYNFSEELIKKMSLAGYVAVQIGIESLSDKLLTKINKATSVADNILFFKYATKYGINCSGSSIIRNLPDETLKDINEATENLKFFRFYINKFNNFQIHNFTLTFGSEYFKILSNKEKAKYKKSNIFHLLPKNFISDNNKFYLLEFEKQKSEKEKTWKMFEQKYRYYFENYHSYNLFYNKGTLIIDEKVNGIPIKSFFLENPIYLEIFNLANSSVIKLEILISKLKEKNPINFSEKEIIKILNYLHDEGLVYFSKIKKEIVSIIDINLTEKSLL